MATLANFETSGDLNTTIGTDPTNYWIAQSFTISTGNQQCSSIQLNIRKGSTPPTADLLVRVETDNSDKPSGSLVHGNATGTILTSGISANPTYDWSTLTFTPFNLDVSTLYWIVCKLTAVDAGWIDWYQDTGAGYADGKDKYSSNLGVNWNDPVADVYFRVIGEDRTSGTLDLTSKSW